MWVATYRLQLHRDFPLRAATEILPYLHDLGISHVYLSPCLQAAPGSLHGYDVIDPTRISDDLGGEVEWRAFQATARDLGLGVLLDIVPNHMATDEGNPWWNDVLSHGPFSAQAETFDLFPLMPDGRWEIVICTLGEPYGRVLEQGQLTIDLESGLPRLRYFDTTWPLNPASWNDLSEFSFPGLEDFVRVKSAPKPEAIARYRRMSADMVSKMRALLSDADRRLRAEQMCREIAADPDRMHALLDRQFYRLAWWKLESGLVNYRRFFNIASLIGVRVEERNVFDATHARIARMVTDGDVHGLRVDHPDGLRDPAEYFARLRKLLPNGRIYVEKILDAEETLPVDWPVDGTVGYDFLSKVNRLWMDENKADAMTAAYADFTGHSVNYPALVREKKLAIIAAHFDADLDRITSLAAEIASARWATRDLSRSQTRTAIELIIAALPVYRTYITPGRGGMSAADEKVLTEAVAAARAQAVGIEPAVFDFLEALLMNQLEGPAEADFIERWQQLCPPIMAKGAEDTTFYCFDRLVSCNEVGAQPSLLGISPDKFHQFCSHMQSRWPANLLATSTHDNKRSEDVRARISVLTEIPERWTAALQRWSAMNQPAWKGREPDRHAEYLLYQTLIGAWPISVERACAYLLKACREAKIHTSWHEPNTAYEEGLMEFTRGIMDSEEFTRDLESFVEPLVLPGRINSLAQTLIKLTAPGTPDFYQGSELWDLSLVDPDNRRPVDFPARSHALTDCGKLTAEQLATRWEAGLPKIWMIQRVLSVRRSHAANFDGAHQPLSARGARLGHLLAYLRGDDVITVVPRFTLTLAGDWEDTLFPVPPGSWRNVFTESMHTGDVSPAELFEVFPVALLIRHS
jgi:(1->4)-alpha-D-glucan 1-alpha-D-glucosylmutase